MLYILYIIYKLYILYIYINLPVNAIVRLYMYYISIYITLCIDFS